MAKRTIVKYEVTLEVVENPPDPQAPLANAKMYLYKVTAQPGDPRTVKTQKQPDSAGGQEAPQFEEVQVYDIAPMTAQGQAFSTGDGMNRAANAVFDHLQRNNADK